jgi:hypothetical protein
MPIYIKRSDGAYAKYQGQSLETITVLLADLGYTGEVITEEEFNQAFGNLEV